MAKDQIEAFRMMRPLYETFRSRLEELISAILSDAGIEYHIVETRTKTVESFSEKISRSSKNYKDAVNEIDDLCGCRIISYYQDDCTRIANIIRNEFNIKEEELSHQPESLEADRFGYISAHYIVTINNDRKKLTEWKAFSELRAEIQIRTVIQHAWSAVSHAVQYKDESRIPSKLQRRLYRIAGLFELADEEFIGIRDQRKLLQEQAADAISRGVTKIPLSSASILEFCLNWSGIKELCDNATKAGFAVEPYEEEDSLIAEIYDFATLAKVSTIDQLEKSLEKDYNEFIRAAFKRYSELENTDIWTASPDFLILLIFFAGRRDVFSKKYLTDDGWGESNAAAVAYAIDSVWPSGS